jgi:hypothetical protein
MARPELHHTLVAAVEAVSPPPTGGLVVTAVDLDLPLEVFAGARAGRPVIGGTVPHSRWTSGFLPDVHLARLRIELVDPIPVSAHGG